MDKTPRSGGLLYGNQAGIAGGQHCRRTVENSTVWAMEDKDVVILLAFWLNVGYNKSNRGADAQRGAGHTAAPGCKKKGAKHSASLPFCIAIQDVYKRQGQHAGQPIYGQHPGGLCRLVHVVQGFYRQGGG